MKVSFIWRIAAFMLIGFALGVFVTSKVFIANIPPGVEIEIAKMKVKGQDNEINVDISPDTEQNETNNKKNRRIFRRKER